MHIKKILLITNKVMHYRVPVYNYFAKRFEEYGYFFTVRSNSLQKENTHDILFDFKKIPFKFLKYKMEINEIAPDFVILFLHLKNFIIWPLLHWLKLKKIPVIFWTKGVNLDCPDSKIRYLFFNYLHSLSDRIILYSKNEIKYIKEKNRSKISVANNTINFSGFPSISYTGDEIKKEYKIPYKKIVLFVGRMGEGGGRKKVHHLIEIFRDIKNEEFGLVLVGSDLDDESKAKLNKKNTIYLGEVHDPKHIKISKLFKMADLCAIPGHVGLGLNQAFFWGLPVVTEEGKQPPEIHYLINGRNGFIVPENDLKKLKEKILYLLENDDIRRKFSENARNDILNNASIENMFKGFLSSIKELEKD